jgi:transmembrane protein 33
VLFKTYSNPRSHDKGVLNLQFASKIWADENTQYFVLALYWFISEPVAIALVPYFCFSAFHFLTYVRTAVIPAIDPTATSPESNSQGARICKLSETWVKANYEKAMRLVAAIEVVAIGSRVLFGVLTFGYLLPKTPITSLLVVVSFLRYRYFTSQFTRQQFTQLALKIDHAVADARVPPVIRQVWGTTKNLISSYAGPQAVPVGQQQRKAQ